MIIRDSSVSGAKKLSSNYTVVKFVNEVIIKKKYVDKKMTLYSGISFMSVYCIESILPGVVSFSYSCNIFSPHIGQLMNILYSHYYLYGKYKFFCYILFYFHYDNIL